MGHWLEAKGFVVRAITSRQKGYDIDARHLTTNQRWVIEAKGATSSKPETKRYGHDSGSNGAYFGTAAAFHNAVSWTGRKELNDTNIGIAIPKTKWFDIHSYKLHPACEMIGITIFRVAETGEISIFPDTSLDASKRIVRPAELLDRAVSPPNV